MGIGVAAVKLWRKYISSYLTKLLGQALVLSLSLFWSGSTEGNLNKLQVAQNKAAGAHIEQE